MEKISSCGERQGEKMIEYVFPVRILESKLTRNEQNLLRKQPLQIGLTEQRTTAVDNGGTLILDFGMQMCGGVRLLVFAAEEAAVHIRFGESLTECCSTLGGEQNATNDHSLRDMTVALPKYSDMTFGSTGFRFVRLDFSGTAELKSVVAVNHILKKPAIYRYSGSDPLIAQIFATAKRTVDLCVANGYVWDGVKRDRLVWIGDIHPQMLALTTLYGRSVQVERSLEFVKEQTPLPGWMNRYPMYSMWWIIILADYFEQTGVEAFTRRQIPYLRALIDQLDAHVLADGTLNYPRYFVDWPTRHQPDELHGARAINILAVQKAIALMTAFEKDTAKAEALLAKLKRIEIKPTHSKQVTALKFFVTELDAEDKARLVRGGASGMSTFMSYYILNAVASFDKAAAIRMMKDYYGAMLSKGATTFWEDFSMDWVENTCRIDEFPKAGQKDIHGDFGAYCYKGFRHSLCHGWSAGVIRFIQELCE